MHVHGLATSVRAAKPEPRPSIGVCSLVNGGHRRIVCAGSDCRGCCVRTSRVRRVRAAQALNGGGGLAATPGLLAGGVILCTHMHEGHGRGDPGIGCIAVQKTKCIRDGNRFGSRREA